MGEIVRYKILHEKDGLIIDGDEVFDPFSNYGNGAWEKAGAVGHSLADPGLQGLYYRRRILEDARITIVFSGLVRETLNTNRLAVTCPEGGLSVTIMDDTIRKSFDNTFVKIIIEPIKKENIKKLVDRQVEVINLNGDVVGTVDNGTP